MRSLSRRAVVLLSLAVLPGLLGLHDRLRAASGPAQLVVFAAASLTESFNELGERFSREVPDSSVTFNFGGSNELCTQLEHGARADVFASASPKELDRAAKLGLVEGPGVVFARNRLVVVLPAANPGSIRCLQDLARPRLKLALAHPDVPAGAYALKALDKMASNSEFPAGFRQHVLDNVVSQETSVKQVVAKVQLGEVDAGFVYRSDVTPKLASRFALLEIPEAFNVSATYPVGVVRASRQSALARRFIELLVSAEGQAVLRRRGFEAAVK